MVKYWKNEKEINLSDVAGIGACSRAVTVAGNDVYVTGAEKGTDYNLAPKYWKNGKEVNLSTTIRKRNGYAEAIAVAGNNVYVAGEENNGLCDVAEYWQNGKVIRLSDGKHNAAAYAIAVVR